MGLLIYEGKKQHLDLVSTTTLAAELTNMKNSMQQVQQQVETTHDHAPGDKYYSVMSVSYLELCLLCLQPLVFSFPSSLLLLLLSLRTLLDFYISTFSKVASISSQFCVKKPKKPRICSKRLWCRLERTPRPLPVKTSFLKFRIFFWPWRRHRRRPKHTENLQTARKRSKKRSKRGRRPNALKLIFRFAFAFSEKIDCL